MFLATAKSEAQRRHALVTAVGEAAEQAPPTCLGEDLWDIVLCDGPRSSSEL